MESGREPQHLKTGNEKANAQNLDKAGKTKQSGRDSDGQEDARSGD